MRVNKNGLAFINAAGDVAVGIRKLYSQWPGYTPKSSTRSHL